MQIERLLLPLTGHPVDDQAAQLAGDLVHATHGRIYALFVIEVPQQHPVDAELPEETARGEQVLARVEQLLQARKCEVTAEFLQAREMGPAVVTEAMEREVALIILGMPYMRRHGLFSMGEAIPYILKSAPCPVLVLREPIPTDLVAVQAGEDAAPGEVRQ